MKIETLRHSLAHILASAVKELYPGTKFGIGPTIEQGFYYDFEFGKTDERGLKRGLTRITFDDLPKIETKMKELIKKNIKFEKRVISKEKSKKIFQDQPYKLELINEISQETVSIYKSGDFIDLCRGPHVKSTKEINPLAFKLTKIAGAYWRGSEKNPMLTRIYGIAFRNKTELENYLQKQTEIEERDHRKTGEQLDLFSFHPEAPNIPFFHPKGKIIYNLLMEFWREIQKKYNYQEIQAPNILDVSVWKQSGHWDHFKDDMFFVRTREREWGLRPMDCPGAILIYKTRIRSYKELPLRFSEPGTIFRHERSGTLIGLFRAYQFAQDDAHIFLSQEQIFEEIKKIMELIDEIYQVFNLDYKIFLSTRPKDFMGEVKTWNKAEKDLKETLKSSKKDFQINPGDGAFYGPKIDFRFKDSLGREWQCGTIQLDFQMPEKFNLEYVGRDGKKHRPIIIHRTIMGSFERFIGILIEHFGGNLPLWLSPVQVLIIPLSLRYIKPSQKLVKILRKENIRCELDDSSETVSYKIRKAEKMKTPYMLVIGEKEVSLLSLTVRTRGQKKTKKIPLTRFLKNLKTEIEKKKI